MAERKKTQQEIKKIKPLSLRDFHKKRNKILIWHDKGGLGDVLMQRMLFEDFKKACPTCDFIFACLPEYKDAAKDHPFIKETIDSRYVNLDDFILHYNTCVSIADRYENLHAPCSENRADIWAKYCGVKLNNYNMHFRLNLELLEKCKKRLKSFKDGPIILFAPTSKMAVKTLLSNQIKTIRELTQDFNLIAIHNKELDDLPGIYDASIIEWMHYVAAADYVISVDTATFHMAGGLGKPLVGIFTFADGKAYGKHYDFILVQKHRDNGNWDCGPCFTFHACPKCPKPLKPCLTELTEEEIKQGIEAMFRKWPVNN